VDYVFLIIIDVLLEVELMSYQLAEINMSRFRLPVTDPVNADFVANLDRVNALAEAQPGFVWRLTGEGNSAIDLQAYDDPNIIVNMSVWSSMDALANFVYRNEGHREIMRRRREWFDKMDFHLALWWVPTDYRPSIAEGKSKIETPSRLGPSPAAFLFGRPFPAPNLIPIAPVLDKCG
jgi:heme-degrading monooxygenase HmoA